MSSATILGNNIPTGAFNPSAGYFSNEPSSYRGGKSKRRLQNKNKNKKSRKVKSRRNRTRRNR